LPFIARSGALLSKTALNKELFNERHFRSTSRRQDVKRGFEEFVHLTLDPHPPILRAKLKAGFPHFEIAIPAKEIEKHDYLLCRFNIAKTRYFRGARQAPQESDENGRYYGKMRLPVAKTPAEVANLLKHNYGVRMIEVLVNNRVPLSADCVLKFFRPVDREIAEKALKQLESRIAALEIDATLTYTAREKHVASVIAAIDRAVKDPDWRGDGMEFDRV
jgi:hypothetical protein